MLRAFDIDVLPHRLAVCRLAADAAEPSWPRGPVVSRTRTPHELSIVCDEAAVPDGVRAEPGWRALALRGPFAFDELGVIAGVSSALAAAGVSVFVLSTFDTDIVLVKGAQLDAAVAALAAQGHRVS